MLAPSAQLEPVPISLLYRTPALLEYANEKYNTVIKNLAARPIPTARLRQLKVSPDGFSTIDSNVIAAVRGKGEITVTKEVITELMEIAKSRNVKDWSWRPPKTSNADAGTYTHWQGPYESRMHKISRDDGLWVCIPASKFIEGELKNATFIAWWTSNKPTSAIVATHTVDGAPKMEVILINSDEPIDQIALLTSVGANLKPITTESPAPPKSVVYSNGRAEIYIPRVGKRKSDDGGNKNKIARVDDDVISDSDTN